MSWCLRLGARGFPPPPALGSMWGLSGGGSAPQNMGHPTQATWSGLPVCMPRPVPSMAVSWGASAVPGTGVWCPALPPWPPKAVWVGLRLSGSVCRSLLCSPAPGARPGAGAGGRHHPEAGHHCSVASQSGVGRSPGWAWQCRRCGTVLTGFTLCYGREERP